MLTAEGTCDKFMLFTLGTFGINTLTSKENGHHFADEIIFLALFNEEVSILIIFFI